MNRPPLTATEHYWKAEEVAALGDRTGDQDAYLAALVHAVLAIEGHLRILAEVTESRGERR